MIRTGTSAGVTLDMRCVFETKRRNPCHRELLYYVLLKGETVKTSFRFLMLRSLKKDVFCRFRRKNATQFEFGYMREVGNYQHNPEKIRFLILIAFITGFSSLEPLIEGLCAQIHVNLR